MKLFSLCNRLDLGISYMKKHLILLLSILLVQGCVETAIVASAVTAVSAANDPRSVGSQIDDNGIEVRATVKLMKDQEVSDNANVTLVSYNGQLLAVGQAPTQALINKIDGILKSVDHVIKVHNQVKVGPLASVGSKAKDVWITTKVKSAFLANDKIEGNKIKVITEAQEVYLLGIVSPEQANEAATVASKISGVERVIKVFE